MIPSKNSLVFYRGASAQFIIDYVQDGDPFDISGYDVKMKIYDLNAPEPYETIEMTQPEINRIEYFFTVAEVKELRKNSRYEILFTLKSDSTTVIPVHRDSLVVSDVQQEGTVMTITEATVGGSVENIVEVKFGTIPLKGDKGDPFQVDAFGLLSERSQYDDEAAGFSFLATDTGELYFKEEVGWSDGVPFRGEQGKSAYQVWLDEGNTGTEQDFLDSLVGADGQAGADGATPEIGQNGNWLIGGTDTGVKAQGEDGTDGVGIDNIQLIDAVGLVKTYRITFTDATTFDYDVTDGADGFDPDAFTPEPEPADEDVVFAQRDSDSELIKVPFSSLGGGGSEADAAYSNSKNALFFDVFNTVGDLIESTSGVSYTDEIGKFVVDANGAYANAENDRVSFPKQHDGGSRDVNKMILWLKNRRFASPCRWNVYYTIDADNYMRFLIEFGSARTLKIFTCVAGSETEIASVSGRANTNAAVSKIEINTMSNVGSTFSYNIVSPDTDLFAHMGLTAGIDFRDVTKIELQCNRSVLGSTNGSWIQSIYMI